MKISSILSVLFLALGFDISLSDNTKTFFLDFYGHFSTTATTDLKSHFCPAVIHEMAVISLITKIISWNGTSFANVKICI